MDELSIDLSELPTVARLREDLFAAFAAYEAMGAHASRPERRGPTATPSAQRLRWKDALLRAPRLRLALLAVIAALVAAGLTVTRSGGSAAWAVQVRGDGTIAVTLRELVGVSGANARLRALRIPVVIQRVQPGCVATGEVDRRFRTVTILERMLRREPATTEHVVGRWVIVPRAIPAGDTLAIVARVVPGRRLQGAYGAKLYRGIAPTCVALGTFAAH